MKYRVAKSKIHGDGVFATQPIKKGEYISDTPDYIDNVNQTIASSFHNHDEKNANVLNVEKGNKRFLIAKRGIEVGEELTADYNLTPSPPFEDPNNFKDLDERELPLSAEEAQAMIDGGFVLEEMDEGGEPHKHPHFNLTHAQKQQAYNDSLTLYNYSNKARNLENELEAFPPQDGMTEGEYDRYLEKTAPGKMSMFNNFLDKYFTENTPEVKDLNNAYLRLKDLNQENPGYRANYLNIPSGYDGYTTIRFTTYDKPQVPIRKPTMEEAYKTVDKDKYPTLEDFVFAAEVFKETGKNPDPENFPSRRLPPPPEPRYEVEDIEPEIEIEKLDIIQPKLLSCDTQLPELE